LEAVGVAADFRPDLVLMDIGMPRMDGYEACRRIRELPFGREVILIGVTGWGHAEDRRKSKAAGFDHHMVKPVEPVAIERLLQGPMIRG
jgi:CheY-like chemotaxis protein